MLTEKITYNEKTVAGMGELSISGISREPLDDTAFGDTVKKYVFSIAEGGSITFKGHYDPDGADGQDALFQALSRGTLIESELKFCKDDLHYLCVSDGGKLLITKAKSIIFEKSNLGKIEFTARVSGGVMESNRKLALLTSSLLNITDSNGEVLYCYK